MVTESTNNVLSTDPNWIFVTFVPGAFGHQISRCLCTSPDVHWYDFPLNGEHPWSWNHFTPYYGWGHSLNHFIPWFKDDRRVSGFGYAQQWHKPATPDLFNQPWMLDKLKVGRLIFNSHDTPGYIRSRFPNAKIILITVTDADWINVITNHIEKSANYPIVLQNGQDHNLEISDWHNNTGRTLFRDWEQHKHNLSQQEWIKWTVDSIKTLMKDMEASASDADVIFNSSNRKDLNSLLQLHKDLKINADSYGINKVISEFDLSNSIKQSV